MADSTRWRCGRALLGLALLLALTRHSSANRGQPVPKFAFDRDDNPMSVPFILNIFLLGFDGNGEGGHELRADQLEGFLHEVFPEHRPSCLETGEKLHVAFEVWYNVVELHSSYLDKFHELMHDTLKDTGETTVLPKEGAADTHAAVPVFQAEVDGPYAAFMDVVYAEHVKNPRYQLSGEARERSYALFLLNPNKAKLAPAVHPSRDFVYRYKTVGAGDSPAFVSRGRYAVLDLTAGPATFGHVDSGEGTVTARTFPKPADFLNVDNDGNDGEHDRIAFLSRLSNNVVNLIKHVFAPDLRFDALDFHEKILVPVLVFRNHMRFDPLEAGHPYSLDIKRITEALNKLALPGQEIEIIWGVHALSDHERIAMALEASSRSDSVHEARDGRFWVKAKHYLDSRMLFNTLHSTSDFLASGLLGASATLSKTYFPDDLSGSTQGTRVLPVYIFSLLENSEPLLFDRRSLYAAAKDVVAVIQTNVENVDLPFFEDQAMVEVSALDATANVIAGLGEALGGLVPPQARWSSLHSRVVFDYTWSLGFHPFGPYSNATELPLLYQDHVLRNSIISRCDAALAKVQDALSQLQAFSEAYLTDPFGADISRKAPPRGLIVDFLYKQRSSMSRIPLSVVDRLHEELEALRGMFEKAAEVLAQLDLQQAHVVSDQVFKRAASFHKYVGEELDIAERGLFCCSIEHSVVTRTNWNLVLRCAIGGLFACAVVLLVLGYTPADPSSLARRFRVGKKKKVGID